MKKIISLSLIASILIGLSGCNGINPVPKENPKEILDIENRIKYVNENQKDYEEILIDKHVYKTDNLNQNKLPKIEKYLSISSNDNLRLKDLSKKLGFPIIVDKSIEMRKIEIDTEFKGELKDILNLIAGITGVYWTYDRGVVNFVKQKDIIYNFPVFSIAKMNNIYNVGETDGNFFKIDDVKSDVFDEIEKTISKVLDNVVFSGDIKETYLYQKDDIRENNLNDSKRNNNISSNKDNKIINNEDKKDIKGEISNNLLEDSTKEDNKNYDYLLSKQNKSGKAQTPDKSILGLEPSLNNRDSLINNSKTNINNVDRKIESLINMNNNTLINEDLNSNLEDNLNENIVKNNYKKNINQSNENIYNTKIQGNASRVSISKESGIIHVSVSPDEENKIDNILESVTKNMLGALINLELFILEVEEEKLAEFNQNFDGVLTSGVLSKSFSLSQKGLTAAYDSSTIANDFINGNINGYPSSSKNLNFVLSYLTGDSKGSILSQPKILSLPNVPARIKDAVFIPYLKPGEITNDTTNITYQVENVNSGIDLGVTSSVIGKELIISLGLRINEYLGDKRISAGTLGEYNLPMQAPKILNNTFRVTPGDILILGGSNKTSVNNDNFENFFLPSNFKNNISKKKFIIVAMPKLVKFIAKED
jgi:hypothetical protein